MMEIFKEPYSSLHQTHLSAKTHKESFKGQALYPDGEPNLLQVGL